MVPVAGDRVIIKGKLYYMSGKDTYHNIVCYDKSTARNNRPRLAL